MKSVELNHTTHHKDRSMAVRSANKQTNTAPLIIIIGAIVALLIISTVILAGSKLFSTSFPVNSGNPVVAPTQTSTETPKLTSTPVALKNLNSIPFDTNLSYPENWIVKTDANNERLTISAPVVGNCPIGLKAVEIVQGSLYYDIMHTQQKYFGFWAIPDASKDLALILDGDKIVFKYYHQDSAILAGEDGISMEGMSLNYRMYDALTRYAAIITYSPKNASAQIKKNECIATAANEQAAIAIIKSMKAATDTSK